MQTIETLKRRINNAEDLLSLVKTMKTLAAINIRQYEKAVESIVEYNRTIEMGFQILLRNLPDDISPATPDYNSYIGAVIFGSDQGMCGPFNEQIVSFSMQELAGLREQGANRLTLTLGTRLVPYLRALEQPIGEAWSIPASIAAITPLVQDLVMTIDAWRAQKDVRRVFLFYNRPLSGASYRPHMLHLLPVNRERFAHLTQQAWSSNTLPMFTMEWSQLSSALLRQYLFISIYRAFIESLMSENASRLATMQSAERSIQDHLDDLNTLFHQQRQQSITEELLDIVAGFEALTTTE